MGLRDRPVLTLIALFLLAPALAAVLITTLLLVGVDPHLVFLPGHAVRSGLMTLGFRVPNPVGVLSTFVFWWGIVVSLWLTLRRSLRSREPNADPAPQ